MQVIREKKERLVTCSTNNSTSISQMSLFMIDTPKSHAHAIRMAVSTCILFFFQETANFTEKYI